MKRNIVLLLSFFLSTAAASSQSFKVESPDGSQVAEISASIVDGKMSITYQETFSRDTLWHNPYGERSSVKDAYNGLLLRH